MTVFVGLTGGVAAGKSAALAAFKDRGAEIFSTDLAAHRALGLPEVRDRLSQRWGDEIVVDGELDRDRIAKIVFGEPEELNWLESVLHPLVREQVAEWRSGLDPELELAVIEVPLLFESDMSDIFDATVAVVADDETRDQRLAERGQVGNSGRETRQMSQADKAERSTHVIHNNGSLSDLAASVAELSATLKGDQR